MKKISEKKKKNLLDIFIIISFDFLDCIFISFLFLYTFPFNFLYNVYCIMVVISTIFIAILSRKRGMYVFRMLINFFTITVFFLE